MNLSQRYTKEHRAKVSVISIDDKILMPCSYAKSKRMVKKGAAKIVKLHPITIKLNFKCDNRIQIKNKLR